MIRFSESRDSIPTELLLWQETPTQIAITDCYTLRVHPTTSNYGDGVINFDIAPQPLGMMSSVEIVTSFKVKCSGDVNNTDQVSIINNIANSLWSLVDIKIADRIDITQSLKNGYAYQSFFDYCLNSELDRTDYLFNTQLFKMDDGVDKAASQTLMFTGDGIVNKAAGERSLCIRDGREVTVSAPLHSPLFTTAKALPTNMKIRISLTQNSSKFLLLSNSDRYSVDVTAVKLNVKFVQPQDIFLSLIEERLAKQAASYYITRPEIILKPISQAGRVVRINQLFPGRLPKHAFFAVQRSADFDGTFESNPFAFVPFGKFQLTINGVPYFNDPLEIGYTTKAGVKVYTENRELLQQLYRTIGRDVKGVGLINSTNLQLNFIIGTSFTNDRSNIRASYISPQMEASTQLELDFGYDINVADDLILLIYCVYDRIIKIDSKRELEIIE